ncbi:hypothetical protein D556_2885 [Bordetella holmesii 41130]|nr:hypothetical protein D558_2890 [Bordetella holmesii 44057]EWM42813.1 hypothetical protein D556_2885 [Bordetella holmesii 41130]
MMLPTLPAKCWGWMAAAAWAGVEQNAQWAGLLAVTPASV